MSTNYYSSLLSYSVYVCTCMCMCICMCMCVCMCMYVYVYVYVCVYVYVYGYVYVYVYVCVYVCMCVPNRPNKTSYTYCILTRCVQPRQALMVFWMPCTQSSDLTVLIYIV